MVRVILLVEDSAKYYSRYLPMLYHIVLEQTKRIIDDVSTDELYKILRLSQGKISRVIFFSLAPYRTLLDH